MRQGTRWNLKLSMGASVGIVTVVVGAYLLKLAATVPITEPFPRFVVIQDVPYYFDRSGPIRQLLWLPSDVAVKNRSSDYVVYEGELYLKVQELSRALILTQYVTTFEWPKERLDQLVKDHPELEVYTK